MHHTGPLPLTFKGPKPGFGGKNCQNESGKTLVILCKTLLFNSCLLAFFLISLKAHVQGLTKFQFHFFSCKLYSIIKQELRKQSIIRPFAKTVEPTFLKEL